MGSGVRVGKRGERFNLAESSNILKVGTVIISECDKVCQDAADRRNRRLSARRASFSGLEEVEQVVPAMLTLPPGLPAAGRCLPEGRGVEAAGEEQKQDGL